MPDTVTIPGVEILRTGVHTGIAGGTQEYTTADLDEMVEAWAALEASGADVIRVVLKGGTADVPVGRVTVGHNELGKDGAVIREAPVVGRLAALRRKGETLVADLADVPAKLAAILAQAYPERSIEGFRLRVGALEVGGRKFRQSITGLALLGEHLPAVTGLADLPRVLAQAGEGFEMDTRLALADLDQETIDQVLAALDSWAAMAIPIVAGATGAPIVRTRIRALKEEIRRIAGGRIANEKESDMSDEADAPAIDPVQNAVADAATALAIISEILGMPDAQPADIVAKVREMAGGASETSGLADGEVQHAAVVALEEERDDALARIAKLEGRIARDDAARDVDALMRAGKAVPAQRDTLIALRLATPGGFAEFAKSAPTVVVLGESGTSAGEEVLTPEEIAVARDMGTDLDELRKWKAART